MRPKLITGVFARMRERLKARPDSEHEMTINRLVIVSAVLLYLTVADRLGITKATAALEYGRLICIAYFGASLLIFAHLLAFPGLSHGRRSIALLVDMGTLGIGMHVGDSAFALGYPIYLWIIFGNGFRFGMGYLVGATAASLASFTAVILTTPVWQRDIDLAIGLLLGLVVLPAYVSVLIRRLSEAKRQAEAASRAKSLFLASVSHELRTPLNAIISLGDLLRDGRLTADQTEMAATISSSGRSLLGLINGILDLSRIEAGKTIARVHPFEPVGVVDQVRRIMQTQAEAKGLALRFWVGAGVPQRAIGPGPELEQVLINLIGNAIKFTPVGAVVVSLDARATGPLSLELVGSVADTGIGIAPEAQGRIFDAFAQADDRIIDNFGGTGLGLAIVREQLRLHGGSIAVSSAPGKGSVFRFSLPLTIKETKPDPAPRGASEARTPVVILSHNPALAAHFGLLGAQVVQTASARDLSTAVERRLAAARANPAAPSGRPVVVMDLDTLSETTLANAIAVLGDIGVKGPIGLIASDMLDASHAAGLPFAIGLGFPPTRDDWARLTELPHAAAPRASVKRQRSLAILVAEDNLTNQSVIRRILERDGHTVTIVDNGEQAVEVLEKRSFDLVLMDINMPVLNGLEATKLHRFAALGRPRTPIHALTADVTDETRQRCREAGLDGILHKPIEAQELADLLAQIAAKGSSVAAPAGARGVDEAGPAAVVVQPAQSVSATSAVSADAPLDLESVPLIDPTALDALFDLGGEGFVEELALQFLLDATRQVAELDSAAAQLDSGAFRDVAHSLRSSSANVGARRLFALCLEWRAATTEDLARHGEAWSALLGATLDATRAAMADALQARAARRLSA